MKTAVYAGTFDPFTNGHADICQRALGLFDQIVVAIAETPNKDVLFSSAQRREMVEELADSFPGKLSVSCFDGLLVDFVRSINAKVIVRGLRAISDYEYEAQMAMMNRQLAPEIETAFLMTSEHCSFISSSMVREVARFGGDVSALVPENVAKRLKKALKK